jgi:hypothetical protein
VTVGLRRPPFKPSDLNRAPTSADGPEALRAFVEELSIRLSQLWEWCADMYRPTQNPSGRSVSEGGGLGGGTGASEDAEILAFYALKKGGGC